MAKKKNSLIDKLSKNKAVKEFIMDEDLETDFISTGALVLNVLFSGRLDGGIPMGKVSQIAAPSSLGKSFVGLKIAKNAQKKDQTSLLYTLIRKWLSIMTLVIQLVSIEIDYL